jgi:hypothetical protein
MLQIRLKGDSEVELMENTKNELAAQKAALEEYDSVLKMQFIDLKQER